MESINTLPRVIYGLLADGAIEVLATSAGLSVEDVQRWSRWVRLDPPPQTEASASESQTHAVGLFATDQPDRYLLALAYTLPETGAARPIYELVRLARADLGTAAGSIGLLTDLLDASLIGTVEGWAASVTPQREPEVLNGVVPPALPTWTLDRRLLMLTTLLNLLQREGDSTGDAQQARALALLGAALDARGLAIIGFPGGLRERLDLLHGLQLLLPSSFRAALTFATHVDDLAAVDASVRVVFADAADARPPVATPRWMAHLGGPGTAPFPDLQTLRSPYLDCLAQLWHDDTRAFAGDLRALELLSANLEGSQRVNGESQAALTSIAERYLQDKQVLAGVHLPADKLKQALSHHPPTQAELRERYAGMLLDHALSERDAEAALLVTRLMDADPALDERLSRALEAALDEQPDAVYFVVRTHLSHTLDPKPDEIVRPEHEANGDQPASPTGDGGPWLPRLHAAAICSLQVAISATDPATFTSWLKLIAREPAAYQLSDVLMQGLRAAQERARTDGALGYQLLAFAFKRAPGSVEALLDDAALLAALPETAAQALGEGDPDAMLALTAQGATGRDFFLAALGLALRAGRAEAVTPAILREFWAAYQDDAAGTGLPEGYRPPALLNALTSEGVRWLSEEAQVTLMILTLTARQDDAFLELTARLDAALPRLLPTALFRSGRPADEVLTLVGQIASAGSLSPQQAVDTYVQLLDYDEWGRGAQPLAEQVARAAQHNQTIVIAPDVAAKLLELAEAGRAEIIGKVMSRRLLGDIEKIEDDRRLVESFARLYDGLDWSATLRTYALSWWRDFVRGQPTARLAALEKVFDNRRGLEEVRVVVQTSMALRRVLGKKSLEEFASAIGTAFAVLQALSDSFDPIPRQSFAFDAATVRDELDARQGDLTPDERRVLAKNLRELGGLIADMAEQRSRATLIRREEEIDRQLMAGELIPHSAIDAMKWLSGYLGGAQKGDADT